MANGSRHPCKHKNKKEPMKNKKAKNVKQGNEKLRTQKPHNEKSFMKLV